MRLAFCFISNKKDNLLKLMAHFHYFITKNSCIDSFTKNVLINPPIQKDFPQQLFLGHDWNFKWKSYHMSSYIDFFWLRQDAISMADNADFIFLGDDDMVFREGSSEAIDECCLHMKEHPDCGAIYLSDKFGNEYKTHDKEIYIINSGHISINRGILVRNREIAMDNRLHAVGACDDWAVGFTAMMQGYYLARKLYVPIEHPVVTRIGKMGDKGVNIGSDIDFLKTEGIFSKIDEVIGPIEDPGIWPKNIFRLYRQAAMLKGFVPKYDADGEMIWTKKNT
jgi:hypothetical protein